jgi:hypothetical protein
MKTGHRNETHSYEQYARVVIDQNLKPVRDINGEVIEEGEDEWVRLTEGGPMVLKRDGQTPMPAKWEYDFLKIRRNVTTYNGSEARPVDFRNFLAPLDAPDLQCKAADCIVEYYDLTAIEIVEQFIARMQANNRWDAKLYPRTLEYLRMASSNARASSAPNRVESGAGAEHSLRADPVIRVAEVHRWYDATQTGRLDNIHMLIDRDTQRPILYDHCANVYDDGQRPYTNIPWWSIDGCWHGVGAVEVFWELQRFIDLTTNRWDLSLSQEGNKVFFNPEQTMEGQSNPRLTINDAMFFRKKDVNVPANRILEQVPIHEFKGAKLEAILQYGGQMFTNLSGTSNANDAAAVGMDTAKLATGVNNIESSGREMFQPILSNMEEGIARVIQRSLEIEIEHMDDEEAFNVMGQDGYMVLASLKKEDAKAVRWHVGLEVSGNKGERELAANSQAKQAVIEYSSLAPPLQIRVNSLYRQILRSLNIRNVDKILPLPTEQDIAAYQQSMQQQAMQQQPQQQPA